MYTRAIRTWSRTAALVALGATATAQSTTLVSQSSGGLQGNADSLEAAVSADGRFSAFVSWSDNLVSEDTNATSDVFRRDRLSGQTLRVSVSSTGVQGNGESGRWGTSISADGRFVSFDSRATNLVPGQTQVQYEVFVHDCVTGETTRVSVDSAGHEVHGNQDDSWISADGHFVAYDSDAPDLWPGDVNAEEDIFIYDRLTGQVDCASLNLAGTPASGESRKPALSADGRWVAFISQAPDLVDGDVNGTWDVFLRDRLSDQTWVVSVSSTGELGNAETVTDYVSISADGRYVAFSSWASNLVAGDTNAVPDIFVHDHLTGQTSRVSTGAGGTQANGLSQWPSLAYDGTVVSFMSLASNLIVGDTNAVADIYVHDLLSGVTSRVSLGSSATQSNGSSFGNWLSGDGSWVAFESHASNLISADANAASDVFLRDREGCRGPSTYCVALINTTGDPAHIGWSGSTSIEQNDFALLASGCPPGGVGLFFCGAFQTLVPFGEGNLCVTGNQHRLLPGAHITPAGNASMALDFGDPYSNAALIQPDSEWNFQFWYRDPQPVGHGFNLTDALHAYFCP